MAARVPDSIKLEFDLVAQITNVPMGSIKGYTIVAYLNDNTTKVATTACCVSHALADMSHLASEHGTHLIPCAPEG